jgi:hypothetical protein
MQFADAPRGRSLGRARARARVAHAVRGFADAPRGRSLRAQPEPGLGRRVSRESIMQSTDAPRSQSLGWADESVPG